jgi:hypothetical protein
MATAHPLALDHEASGYTPRGAALLDVPGVIAAAGGADGGPGGYNCPLTHPLIVR